MARQTAFMPKTSKAVTLSSTRLARASSAQQPIDITELKRAEALHQQSEAEYGAVFELAGVGNAQVDYQTGRILRANRRLCEMLGFTCDPSGRA